ncbi:MAG: nitroreductase family deazaflavin-dependent oxidoreductase [Chloroflexota bacterium]
MDGTESRPATAAAAPRTARIHPITSALVNPLMRRIGGRVPGYGVLTHVGRRSGRVYRTPIKYFRHDGEYVIALMYGTDSDWLRNIEAAGGATLTHGGRAVAVGNPRRTYDPTVSLAPAYVRPVFQLLRVAHFVTLAPTAQRSPSAGASPGAR